MTRRPGGDPVARFLLGASAGLITGGITYAITTTPPWWWAVGLTAAGFVWFGGRVLTVLD